LPVSAFFLCPPGDLSLEFGDGLLTVLRSLFCNLQALAQIPLTGLDVS